MKRIFTLLIFGLFLLGGVMNTAIAQNLISNGSFESPVISINSYQYGTPTSWNWSSSERVIHNGSPIDPPTGTNWPPPRDGQQYINIGNVSTSSLSQSFTVTNGSAYQLAWYDNAHFQGGTSPYSVSLINSVQQIIAIENFNAAHGGVWQYRSLLFNLFPGNYTLTFTAQGIPFGYDTILDAVSIEIPSTHPAMSQWVGKWFTIKMQDKGTGFDTINSKFYKENTTGTAYMNISSWDPIKKEFQLDICSFDKDDGQWSVENLKLVFLAGTHVKFLSLFDGLDQDGENEGTVFTALMEGKEKNGIFQSATFKTLGGSFVEIYDDDTKFRAGSFNLNGKMIDSSKVPADCKTIQP